MQARVLLQPEPGLRHFGKFRERTIEMMPAFLDGSWWVRFTHPEQDKDYHTYAPSMSAARFSGVLEAYGYDLRSVSWTETKSQRLPYNPFIGKLKTVERCSHVYFARNGRSGLIKIGYSGNYSFRLKQIGFQFKVEVTPIGLIEGAFNEERAIHDLLKEYRVEGEWFQDCETVRSFIVENTYLP